ncbi:zinc finger family protein [Tripterygium wilfordii]|uniref:RBR-type E3 ubiquitin transferase n=1 Tax=Tripterygium wilfordii TaxID=458696 RepID=A0A7J7C7C0_TRIWF|nr:probable E3 ubiquitin-protein ligase RNF144A-A [Tripterygium wilfordii]KAF5729656.1 zinc finger family protein [Tripterygium wilfordii]
MTKYNLHRKFTAKVGFLRLLRRYKLMNTHRLLIIPKMAQEPTSILDSVDDFYFSALFEEDQEEILQVSDAKYAQELQLQEALMGSVTLCNSVLNQNLSSPSPMLNIQLTPVVPTELVIKTREDSEEGFGESSSSMSFCKICIERKESDDMFTIDGCDHSFCSDCVGKHVQVKIQETLSVVCPGLGCRNVLQLEACRPVISKDVIDLWEMTLCEDLISETQKFYCPFKDCSAMMLIENEEGEVIRESECPFCHRLFCAQCSAGWHPGVECEEYQRLNEDERGREDLMVRELANENKWSRCPKCRFYVERTEGCPHITCRCNYQFCYGCEEEWSQSHAGCHKQ